MPRALKVFRTAIGFHDAYVAAPSRKAALAAWGATADLFARGIAEEVDDPALTAEPLARPGEVIKRSRGTAAEQMAALPPDAARTVAKPLKAKSAAPSRAALDAAERALAEAGARHRDALADLAERKSRLARERRKLERGQAAELAQLERARNDEAQRYETAVRRR
jgi:hypothetical protein